jgi:hypothetical protein
MFNPNPAPTTPSGSYLFTITGTSSSLSHTTKMTLVVVGDFSLNVSPSIALIGAGGKATYTVTMSRLNGFSGLRPAERGLAAAEVHGVVQPQPDHELFDANDPHAAARPQ